MTQAALEADINLALYQLTVNDSPQDMVRTQQMFTDLHSKLQDMLAYNKQGSFTDVTDDVRPVYAAPLQNANYKDLIDKSGKYFINNPTDNISGLPVDEPGHLIVHRNLQQPTLVSVMFITLGVSASPRLYLITIDTDSPDPTDPWIVGSGTTFASTYKYL